MKILILSDTHGFTATLEEILKKERTSDMIIHLGDGGQDLFSMSEYTAGKPVYNIKGNCDMASYNFPLRLITYAEDIKFLACHGHTYNVKTDLNALFYAAKEEGCRVALYGHTHTAHFEEAENTLLFNPGSVMNYKYGIMEVSGDTVKLIHRKL